MITDFLQNNPKEQARGAFSESYIINV